MPGWLESTLRTGWIIALVAGVIWLIVVLAKRMPQHPVDAHAGPRSHSDFWTNEAEPQPRPASFAAGATGAATANPAAGAASQPSPQSFSASNAGAPFPGYGPTQGSTSFVPTPEDTERRRAEAWQRHEDAQRRHAERMQHAEQRRVERTQHWRQRQPSAAFVAISLGLAVVAAGLAVVWAQASGWADSTVVLAIASGLGVLALATVIAGIRGRESGGLGFFSTISVIALIIVGIVPSGSQLSLFGDTTWKVTRAADSREASYVMFAGSPTLDLRELPASDGDVDMWLAFGTTDILLPDDTPVRVEVSGLINTLDVSGRSGDDDDHNGILNRTIIENDAAKTATADEITTVHAWVFIGSTDIER